MNLNETNRSNNKTKIDCSELDINRLREFMYYIF